MASLRTMAACIGLSGSVSVVRDFFGLRAGKVPQYAGAPNSLSLRDQSRRSEADMFTSTLHLEAMMATLNLRASLMHIGAGKPGQTATTWPHGFHSSPRSLKAAMLAMRPPRIGEWILLPFFNQFDNFEWTEECNGVTNDGQSWYFSSSNPERRAIHKFTAGFAHVGSAKISDNSHLGDIDFFGGHIFAALEPRRVAVFDTTPKLVRVANLDPKGAQGESPHTGMPWCAVNPWNGFLYSSNFDGVDRVHAYDPKNNFAYRGFLRLQGPAVGGVQGGCFTANGHLYLTSDTFMGTNATKDIRAYSTFNGAFLGSKHVPYDTSTLEAEEMEGIALAGLGPMGHVHVVILDNDAPSKDDVFLKHFAVPDPAVL